VTSDVDRKKERDELRKALLSISWMMVYFFLKFPVFFSFSAGMPFFVLFGGLDRKKPLLCINIQNEVFFI